MEFPPVAMALSSASLASDNGRSVCRAARTHACAAYSASRSATRATGAASPTTCATQTQNDLAHCIAVACFSQQRTHGCWPIFLQTPSRVAPASARFLPLIVRFPWSNSLQFCQAGSLASIWSCGLMILLASLGRTLAGFFAIASACEAGKRALFVTHRPIPVAQFLAFWPSLVDCFNWVMLVQVTACWAVRALALSRTTRRALEPARAARRLAAGSPSRGASAARLPAALPRAAVYLPPTVRRSAPNP